MIATPYSASDSSVMIFKFKRPLSININNQDAFIFGMRSFSPEIKELKIELFSDESGSRRAAWPLGAESERMGIDATRLDSRQNYRLPFLWSIDYNFEPAHIAYLAISFQGDQQLEISTPSLTPWLPLPFPVFFNDPRAKNINFNYTGKSRLPIYELIIPADSIQKLNQNLPDSGRRPVVASFMDDQKNQTRAEVKYRGDKPIHYQYFKRSWRVEFPKDQLFRQSIRRLNLIVPEQLHFGTIIPYLVADSIDIMTPQAAPVRLVVNNIDMGTYNAVEQVDEQFLKRRGKDEGILYIGDVNFDQDLKEATPLFESSQNWQTKAVGSRKSAAIADPLNPLLETVALPLPEFETEIKKLLDIDSYLRWYALYNVFNSMHNDNIHNVKMFFDDRTGKFEMIPWDIDPDNTVIDPLPRDISNNRLSHKLFQIPQFALRRDQIFYQIIDSWFNNQKFEQETEKLTSETKSDVLNSIFTLPSVSSNYDKIINDFISKISSRAVMIGRRLVNPDFQLCRVNSSLVELTIISNSRFVTGNKILSPQIGIEPAEEWMVNQGIVHRSLLSHRLAKHYVSSRQDLVNPITNEVIFTPADIDLLPKCG